MLSLSITRWPRPSTASTRPRSSIGAGRGGPSRPSNSQPSNGWTGSTIAGCSNPSATSRRQKLNADTTLCSNNKTWQRDSNQIASGEPGAVQTDTAANAAHEPAPTPRSGTRSDEAVTVRDHIATNSRGFRLVECLQENPMPHAEGVARQVACTKPSEPNSETSPTRSSH